VRAEDIHLSYTNPLTSHARPWDWGERYVEIDGLVLAVKHSSRCRGALWSAELFTDHIETMPMVEWVHSDGLLTFAHVRRQALLE
jgi:hypothetical protein